MTHSISDDANNTLEAIAGILIRCFALLLAAQLWVWLWLFIAGDQIFHIHSKLFNISRQNYDLYILYAMALMKILNFVLFLIPYIAIKLVLRGKRTNT